MIDLYELRQLTAFADLGTLSKVAEEFHISTPSVTRSMQHLEDAFGVPLFIRGKNRIELNDTGNTAVEYARKLLTEAEQAVAQVRAFDQRQRTILVKSCAPAPLWELLKALNAAQPEKWLLPPSARMTRSCAHGRTARATLPVCRFRLTVEALLCRKTCSSASRKIMNLRRTNP